MPGTGRPTVPSRNACGVLVVNAPVVSLIPYTSRIRTPRPPKNSPTSGGSGAAPLHDDLCLAEAQQRPDRAQHLLVRRRETLAASSADVVWPYCTAAHVLQAGGHGRGHRRLPASSCSPASSAWMPAMTFSKIRGTPKNAVGLTSLIVAISWVAASWQK